jgi:hypothetical protein
MMKKKQMRTEGKKKNKLPKLINKNRNDKKKFKEKYIKKVIKRQALIKRRRKKIQKNKTDT